MRVPLSDLAAASLSHLGNVAEVLTTRADRPRLGNTLFGAFGRDFLTADGARIMVVAITPRQWDGLLKALGLQSAVQSLEARLGISFAEDEGVRFVHRDHLFPLFERAFLAHPLASLASRLDQCGVTWSRYQSIREAVQSDARLFGCNPIFQDMVHPSGLTYPAAGPAATVAGAARARAAAAPRLGEHTSVVLRDLLGLEEREIERLHAAGIVASPQDSAT